MLIGDFGSVLIDFYLNILIEGVSELETESEASPSGDSEEERAMAMFNAPSPLSTTVPEPIYTDSESEEVNPSIHLRPQSKSKIFKTKKHY